MDCREGGGDSGLEWEMLRGAGKLEGLLPLLCLSHRSALSLGRDTHVGVVMHKLAVRSVTPMVIDIDARCDM